MEAVITGMGSVCALGRGTQALWSGIEAGRDGIADIRRFATQDIKSKIAGMVPDRNSLSYAEESITDLNLEFALAAAQEAWSMAGLDAAVIPSHRIALVLGTSLGDFRQPLHEMTEALAARMEIGGPVLTVSTACSSSTNALGLAMDLLRQGFADAVLAGGTDVLNPTMLAGFNSLGVLSEGKCAPFSLPFGTTLGEGAGILVLENGKSARKRGARIQGCLLGYGLSGDAFHETSPDPTGAGVARSIAGALGHARIAPEKITYVNAHGTGTSANDPAEWRALLSVFGGYAHRIPVSSTKSYLGHAQGACGVLESMVTLMSMRRQSVPPTLNATTARKHAPSDPVFSAAPRPHRSEYSVCTNSAFGGANAAVILGLGDGGTAAPPRPRKTVYVAGIGAVAAHGLDAHGILPALLAGRRINAGRVPDFSWSERLPNIDPRGLDPSSRFLTAAARLAMADGGSAPKKTRNDRIGLLMGIDYPSPESFRALDKSIQQNGLPRLSTSAFSRMVLNAPAGTCSKLLALGGPLSTISTGSGCGLAALAYAADWLGTREDADALVAGGLDEFGTLLPEAAAGEGAACALLSTQAAPGTDPIVITGWGFAGRGRIRDAVRLACRSMDHAEADFDTVSGSGLETLWPDKIRLDPEPAFGFGPAFTSAMAFVAAVQWLRAGKSETVLVADAHGRSTTCAIILSRRGEQDG
jgi:3-oxoacyl-[acyl-carrier-protein] synthase II